MEKVKELWVKKSVWRRYLIKEEDVKSVTELLDFAYYDEHSENPIEHIENCYDTNQEVEYDEEEHTSPIEFEIKDAEPPKE